MPPACVGHGQCGPMASQTETIANTWPRIMHKAATNSKWPLCEQVVWPRSGWHGGHPGASGGYGPDILNVFARLSLTGHKNRNLSVCAEFISSCGIRRKVLMACTQSAQVILTKKGTTAFPDNFGQQHVLTKNVNIDTDKPH